MDERPDRNEPGFPWPGKREARELPGSLEELGIPDLLGPLAPLEPPGRPGSAPPNLDPDGGYPFQAFEALEPGTHGLDGLAITDLLGSMPLQLEPPGRPGSAPPILHPDGFSPFLETAATFEAARKAAYREQLELPSRPRSAPLEEEIVNVLREEAFRMDPREKDIFAFQAAAVAPPRSPSPFMGEGDLQRQRALFGLAPARALQAAAALEADRYTPPPTQVHPSLLSQSPVPHSQSPAFGSPGLHGPVTHQPFGDDAPALLHPGAVRAFDPINRPISAPPAPESSPEGDQAEYSGDIRCDPLYRHFWEMKKGQNVNLPKPLDPCEEIANHRPGCTGSEFGQSQLASDMLEHMPAPPPLGLGFVPATGFSTAYGHVPRSPSPPWDSSSLHSAQASSHAASQEPAGQTGLGVPPLPGSLQGLPLTSTSGVHGYLEATLRRARHQPLLGTAGYPTGVPPASFPWGQVPMSLLPAGLPAGVARAAAREDVSLARSPDRGAIGRLPPSAPTPCTAAPEPKALARAAVTVHSVPEGTRGAGAAKAEEVERKPRSAFKLSQLEEMFKSSAYINNVYCIAKDQAGCRMLQHKLDEGGPDVFAAVFSEVVTHAVELMMDPFGNYLCQKLMEMSSARQLEVLVDKTYGSLVNISLNMHGARAVQKLIDVVRMVPVCMTRLVGALEFAVVTLTKDPNGNHVVQRCLESLPSDAHGFIFRAVAKDIEDVASHRHGCRIVQRCIDAAKGSDRTMLIGAICRASLTLIQDPFGNYVVQYVLGLQDPQASSLIVTAMTGRLNVLSRQKFSSNVVERCLQLASPEDRARMITELADPRGLGDLLRDIYGNYVVQSALNIAVEPQISAVLAAVRPLLPSLRSSGQGRRIAQKLEKKFPQLRERGPNSEGPSRTGLAAIPQAAGGAGGGGVAAPWPPAAQGGLDAPGAYLVPGAVTPGILNAAGLGASNLSDGMAGASQRKKGRRGTGAGPTTGGRGGAGAGAKGGIKGGSG